MSLLFETVRISDGVPQHMEWHEKRMNRSVMEVWGTVNGLKLSQVIVVPAAYSQGMVRCNIRYGQEIRDITFHHYEKRMIRSLMVVVCDTIDYHLKYSDRTRLDGLYSLRGKCDEIIIVKNGLVTDTSLSNLIFQDGQTWITPAKPLLKGTCRERLIQQGFLKERDIKLGDITGFDGCKLINAMRDPEEEEPIPVSEIHY